MNGIWEKFNFSIIIAETTTRLLPVKLANLSISTLRLLKAVLTKALSALFFFSMDDLFSSEDDDHLLDLDYHPYARKRPLSSSLYSDEYEETDEESNRQKLYLVSYRWWKEAQRSVADQIGGVLYTVLSNNDDADSEIVLDLRKEESSGTRDKAGEVASGREYALVNEALWLRTLKWHNDRKTSEEDARYPFVAEDQSQEVFALLIRLSFSPETNSLLVKISLKDNTVDLYRRACSIFSYQSELFQIWDFSGQTSQFVMNEMINLPNISPGKLGKEEFLAFLLDGLHEDLNRVKCKPYIEAKDAEGRPGEEVADEYWQNHLARNDSIIVDVCQGQYRSILVCHICKKVSVTFDPFMYLTLPLPSTTMRTMTVTVFSSDGIVLPTPFTVTVPKCGRLKDLVDTLSVACSLRNDETLLVAEIFKNQIFRLLDEPSDSLALIRDADKLVAYRLPKVNETYPLVVFSHQQLKRPYSFGVMASNWKPFGVPVVARIQDFSSGSEIRNQFLKLLSPFLMPVEDVVNDYDGDETGNTINENSKMEDIVSSSVPDSDAGSDSGAENDFHLNAGFKFYLVNKMEPVEIKMNEPVPISRFTKKLDISIHWSDKMIEKYDTCLLSSLPEVFKPQLFTGRPQESISLYKCLQGFLQEEPLGPDDMWYCPRCKKPRQANKKLDLWRLPEILVIHLKRFSYSRFFKNKLETYVDFPIHDLNLSNYISHIDGQISNCYQLYAISNHYGGMGGGHYTAFVDYGHGRWYEFDDDRVFAVNEDRIKTSAAYVLFYRRVREV
ncbi:ubiquitin carboxyl-terminal hydrolase 8-like isoform X2 [Durio zibethinus]|uniref:Ubiquitin carboxyl-terminal hydrolase 8-like isoform X2 n=1 Tax=Durio zibethinus TaxID=66656 RepID=A0A6P5YVD8_DURZI|nr:ubiquitin carboxyl-terminal hydrolase 8-like isoform X2 [Durio zibethinus]